MNPCLDLVEMEGSIKQARWARAIQVKFNQEHCQQRIDREAEAILGCTEPRLIIKYRELIAKGDAKAFCEQVGVQWIQFRYFEGYARSLLERRTTQDFYDKETATHSHSFMVGTHRYFFTACGPRQWLHKGDTGAFAYYERNGRRRLLKGTLVARNKGGSYVCRGDRHAKRSCRKKL